LHTKSIRASVAVALVLAMVAAPAKSAVEPDPLDVLASNNPDFAQGKRAVEARDWKAAIKWLTAADKRAGRNADIQNYLGFAYRNDGQLEVSFKHYEQALKINPRHLGAHEYIGEAYLMARNLAKAEEHLAALKRVCPGFCEEHEDLNKKIADYRARNK
jgi:tetratricopeptide (TPR) repeat protein